MLTTTLLPLLIAAVAVQSMSPPINECVDAEGKERGEGESFLGPDNCNTCRCLNGRMACTRKLCLKTQDSKRTTDLGSLLVPDNPTGKRAAEGTADCGVDSKGNPYAHGTSFSPDGCNTCFCHNGMMGCTLMACVERPLEN